MFYYRVHNISIIFTKYLLALKMLNSIKLKLRVYVTGHCFDFPPRSGLLNFKGSSIIEDAGGPECLLGL